MEYIFPILLTLAAVWSIIKIVSIQKWNYIDSVMYSQSSMHYRLNSFMPNKITTKEKIISQADRHIRENMIKIVVVNNKAYWTANNIFYVADVDNGEISSDTVKEIDTSEMSKSELDKMLDILDNLKDGGE